MGTSEGLAGRIKKAVEDVVGPVHAVVASSVGEDGKAIRATSTQHVAVVQHRGRTWVSEGPPSDVDGERDAHEQPG